MRAVKNGAGAEFCNRRLASELSFCFRRNELKPIRGTLGAALAVCAAMALLWVGMARGQNASFHNAPATAREMKNPLSGKVPANAKQVFATDCAKCHGDMHTQTVAERKVDHTMGFCVQCHRANNASVDCVTCHF